MTAESGGPPVVGGWAVGGGHVLLMDIRIVRSNLVHAVLIIYSETEAVLTGRKILGEAQYEECFRETVFCIQRPGRWWKLNMKSSRAKRPRCITNLLDTIHPRGDEEDEGDSVPLDLE